MHLSNKPFFRRLRPFIRLDGYGNIIPGSIVFRERMPKNGVWKQLDFINACCDFLGQNYIILQMDPAITGSTLTKISYPGYNWSGSLGANSTFVIHLPGATDEVVTITATVNESNPHTKINIAASTANGSGTITASPTSLLNNANPQTFTLTTTSDPNSQYLVKITSAQ